MELCQLLFDRYRLPLSRAQTFHVLQNDRRRFAITILAARSSPVAFVELVDRVVARERARRRTRSRIAGQRCTSRCTRHTSPGSKRSAWSSTIPRPGRSRSPTTAERSRGICADGRPDRARGRCSFSCSRGHTRWCWSPSGRPPVRSRFGSLYSCSPATASWRSRTPSPCGGVSTLSEAVRVFLPGRKSYKLTLAARSHPGEPRGAARAVRSRVSRSPRGAA